MSTMVAPELMKVERVVLRDEGAREWRPPSEKESGVRLRTAMMRVWRVGLREWIEGTKGESGVNGDSGVSVDGMHFSCARKVGARFGDGRVSLGTRLSELDEYRYIKRAGKLTRTMVGGQILVPSSICEESIVVVVRLFERCTRGYPDRCCEVPFQQSFFCPNYFQCPGVRPATLQDPEMF